jgi:hypothetical protein
MRIWIVATRVACIVFLSLFVLSETYSAAATALDNSPYYPSWEPLLGRGLFILPCLLAAGMFILCSDRNRTLGFSLAIASLFLYGAFFVFEDFAYRGNQNVPGFNSADGFWIVSFVMAFLAAYLLKARLLISR